MPQRSLGAICPLPPPSCQGSAWDNPLLPYSSEQAANGKTGFPKPGSRQPSTSHGTGGLVLSTLYPCYPFQPLPSPCRSSNTPCKFLPLHKLYPPLRVLILVNYHLTAKAHSNHLLLPGPPRVPVPDSIPVPVCTCLLTPQGSFYPVMSLLGGLS